MQESANNAEEINACSEQVATMRRRRNKEKKRKRIPP
jgi:hypothetical protein